jgi:hypothetical protein
MDEVRACTTVTVAEEEEEEFTVSAVSPHRNVGCVEFSELHSTDSTS